MDIKNRSKLLSIASPFLLASAFILLTRRLTRLRESDGSTSSSYTVAPLKEDHARSKPGPSKTQLHFYEALDCLPLRLERRAAQALPFSLSNSRRIVRSTVAIVPLLVYTLHPASWTTCEAPALLTMVWYAILSYFVIAGFHFAIRRTHTMAPQLWLFAASDDDRVRLHKFVSRWLNGRRESALIAISIPVAIAVTMFFEPRLSPSVGFCPASYVSVTFIGTLTVLGAYYAIGFVLTVRVVSAFNSPQCDWLDPARTPAIRQLSKLLGQMTLRASWGGLAALMPLVIAYAAAAAEQPADYLDDLTTIYINAGFVVIAIVLLVFVAIPPQIWLYRVASKQKEDTLRFLSEEMERHQSVHGGELNWEEIDKIACVYQTASIMHVRAFSREPFIHYLAAFLASFVPLIGNMLASSS